MVICGHAQGSRKFEWPVVQALSWSQSDTLPYSSSPIINKYPFFAVYFVLCFSHFYAFSWWLHCLKWPPVICWSAVSCFWVEEGYDVPYREKYVLDKLRWGGSCAVGQGFHVNKPATYIKWVVFKQKHIQSKVIYCSFDENVLARGLYEPNFISPRNSDPVFTKSVFWVITSDNYLE